VGADSAADTQPASVAPRVAHRVGDVVRASRVVVVRKTTSVERLGGRRGSKLATLVAAQDPLADRVQAAHAEHIRTLAEVERVLHERRMEFRVVPNFTRPLAAWADLVVTVGGDGTFLRASHSIAPGKGGDGPPMLGVNSAASSSIGYFCAARCDDFAHIFEQILAGEKRSRALWRLEVSVNGKPLRDLALNDVLLAHRVPAETTRYVLAIDGAVQEQKSSGIWIATAAGSTAAIRSAGGQVLDIDDRRIQYRVRELMLWPLSGAPLTGGLATGRIDVTSRMSTGVLYMDGGHQRVAFGFGDCISFRGADKPMPWVAPVSLEQRREAWLSVAPSG